MRTLTFIDVVTQEESSYLLPGEWDELTPDQLLFLVDLVNRNISAEEIKLKMLLYCLKARVRKHNVDRSFRIKIKKKYFDLSVDELYAICEIFDYLFTEDMQRINPLLIINPFPVIRIGLVKLYGPADGLTDNVYEDFANLQIGMEKAGYEDKYINDLFSVMYKRKNGKSSKLVSFIPYKKKVALLWFFAGCIMFMQEKFPLVFSGDASGGSTDVADGQMRIIDALAKNDVTKKEQVKKSLLYDALYSMQLAAEEYKKLNTQK